MNQKKWKLLVYTLVFLPSILLVSCLFLSLFTSNPLFTKYLNIFAKIEAPSLLMAYLISKFKIKKG